MASPHLYIWPVAAKPLLYYVTADSAFIFWRNIDVVNGAQLCHISEVWSTLRWILSVTFPFDYIWHKVLLNLNKYSCQLKAIAHIDEWSACFYVRMRLIIFVIVYFYSLMNVWVFGWFLPCTPTMPMPSFCMLRLTIGSIADQSLLGWAHLFY